VYQLLTILPINVSASTETRAMPFDNALPVNIFNPVDELLFLVELCGCCSAFKPRYKRLVDSIFPADPQVRDWL
jgi:hypothetical protein